MRNLKLHVYLNSNNTKQLVGQLLHVKHDIYFEYSSEFISTGLELSPFHLPLKPGVQSDLKKVFSGLPGLFNDSLPDGWGLLLMDRYFRTLDIDPFTISPLERLAYLGDRALGALSYEPSQVINYDWHSKLNLENIASHCEQILHGKDHEILPEIIIAGGSPGGARPKVLICYNETNDNLYIGKQELLPGYKPYLVKFSAMVDINDLAEVEYAYSLMARDCGIDIPKTLLLDAKRFGKAFAIERFDRENNTPVHMHTLSGLLHADFRIPNLDYADFFKATWLLTQDLEQIKQAYRRMVFNVLTHNRDDHSKNFSFLMKNNQWFLSPAYDLTFSAGIAGEHTMTIAGEGANPQLPHLLKLADKLDITKSDANEIINHTKSIVANWGYYADKAEIDQTTSKRFHKIFNNISI